MSTAIEQVQAAIQDLQQGKMIILVDHPDRENEGDLIFPAETVTPSVINFMIRHGSGIVCLSLTKKQLTQLNLPLMVPEHENTSQRGTPFTVSFDAKHGITTGVSSYDRCASIQAVMREGAQPEDLVRPGHVFPLCVRSGGVLERTGHTEGAMDLVRLAGFKSGAVLCEIMNPDGTMMRGEQLQQFAGDHQLKILSIDDLVTYRFSLENLIDEEASTELLLETYGLFTITVVKEKLNGSEHIVLSRKNKKNRQSTLVRIHSSCATGDLFHSARCDCRQQLDYSLQRISEEGGVLIYLNQEGRGIGLLNKIKAYHLQIAKGLDTVEANQYLGLEVDPRKYYIAANILRNRGIDHVRLLTNNPSKVADLEKYGITHLEIEPMPTFCNEFNKNYLHTKKEKLHHMMGELN